MGIFGSTRTRTRLKPVPGLMGMGTVRNYPWVTISRITVTNSNTNPVPPPSGTFFRPHAITAAAKT